MTKVLIITYYWPPSGGGGVQRWLKFAKYLPLHGIKPYVVVPENADYPVRDISLSKEVDLDKVEVYKVPIWEPYQLLGLFKKNKGEKNNAGIISKKEDRSFPTKVAFWLRGNLLIPDPRRFWVKSVVKKATRIIQENSIDVVITTGPPHSVHLAGLKLKKKLSVKWIADFRDPWSTIDYLDEFYLTSLAMRLHKKLERNVLLNADKVIAVSENWKEELEELGRKNVEVITNGYDSTDFKSYTPVKPEKFVISHIGFVSAYRIPSNFLKVLDDLCETNKEFADALHIDFIGMSGALLREVFEEYKYLKGKVFFKDYLPHNKVIDAYGKSFSLLLLLNDTKNAMGHIPGKFFEYLASGKQILAIGPEKGDVAKILNDTQAGVIQSFNNVNVHKEALLKLFGQFQKGGESKVSDKIKTYSREQLTLKLKNLIEDI